MGLDIGRKGPFRTLPFTGLTLQGLDVAVMLALVTGITLYFMSPLKRELLPDRDREEDGGIA